MWKVGTEAEAEVSTGWLSLLSYTTREGPPTVGGASHTNQENALKPLPTSQGDGDVFSTEAPS